MGSVKFSGASEIKGRIKRQERYFKPIIMSFGFCDDGGGSTPQWLTVDPLLSQEKNESIM